MPGASGRVADMDEQAAGGVVRASRFEVVDGEGRVRAVLGMLDTVPGRDPDVGLVLLDQQGRRRLWVAIEPTGPVVVVDQDGNIAVELGVHDVIDEAGHVGAYLVVADRDGRAVAGWRVEDDGTVTDLGLGAGGEPS